MCAPISVIAGKSMIIAGAAASVLVSQLIGVLALAGSLMYALRNVVKAAAPVGSMMYSFRALASRVASVIRAR